ncbi:MAG: glutamine--tRNA ligase/YqeY domain fusion protein [Candidatus Neomarinimicrobiota bacterium]
MSLEPDYKHFIQRIIEDDNLSGKFEGRVHTRFPPEPNAYLHIGHAKSVYLNYGLAQQFSGKFNLRFDDTNPIKEEAKFVKAIIEDVRWLGADWETRLLFASDYFQQLYDLALVLINKGRAFVCDQNAEDIRKTRGTLKKPGQNSPFRDRSVNENLNLFEQMRRGDFPDGTRTLRAKIDMAHPNLNMRDPVIYRILHASHHRTGNDWCIYPLYDWAHGLEDSIEKITHSICTLEFEDHRLLYDWYLETLDVYRPQQIEFARMNVSYTITSKRKLKQLVDTNQVDGFDDPRLLTISGLRRRGYTPASIKNFTENVGVSKRDNIVEMSRLEHSIRQDLNKRADRAFAVLNPLKIVLTNYPDDKTEMIKAVNNPEDSDRGTRELPFGKEIFIERDDFMEDPPRKFFRLGPGREVRLKYAYYITCHEIIKNSRGEIVELRCTYDPLTKGGSAPDGRKVKGTIHWVSSRHALRAEVRLFDRLFTVPHPGREQDFTTVLNPDSKIILMNCRLEPALKNAGLNEHYQFERLGYFILDPDSKADRPVFNRTVPLRDSWAKLEKQGQANK